MKINSISITNFQSFSGTHTLRVDTQSPGLYLIQGDNQDEPLLGANGSGKSTILNAISWCLYGKTLRGLKAGNVRSWGISGTCEVVLELILNGKPCTIKRTWNPVKLVITYDKDEVITQEALVKQIGLSYDAFCSSVLIGQFSSTFFDLSPSEKLTLFSSILNLDVWLKCSDEAGVLYNEASNGLMRCNKEMAYIEGSIASLQEVIDQLELDSNSYESDKEMRLASLGDKLKNIVGELDLAAADLAHKSDLIDQLTVQSIADLDEVRRQNDKYARVLGEYNSLETDAKALRKEISGLRNDLNKFNSLGGECAYCQQVIPHSHKQSHIDKISTRLEGRIKLLDDVEEVLSDMHNDKDALLTQSNKLESRYRKVIDKINNIKSERNVISNSIIRLQASEESLVERIEYEKNGINHHKDKIKELMVEIDVIQKNKNDILAECQKFEQEQVSSSFWIKGFKRIRLYHVNRALTRLGVEVNNVLSDLGLPDWRVEFSVEHETKTGTVAKEFSIMVKAPNSDQTVPWEAWSGGETQRLRLAGILGMASLIQDYTGVNSNLEAFDEPTQFLDGEGITLLLDALQKRAERLGKSIWLIDHRSLEYGGFKGRISIIKKDGVSRIEEVDCASNHGE